MHVLQQSISKFSVIFWASQKLINTNMTTTHLHKHDYYISILLRVATACMLGDGKRSYHSSNAPNYLRPSTWTQLMGETFVATFNTSMPGERCLSPKMVQLPCSQQNWQNIYTVVYWKFMALRTNQFLNLRDTPMMHGSEIKEYRYSRGWAPYLLLSCGNWWNC